MSPTPLTLNRGVHVLHMFCAADGDVDRDVVTAAVTTATTAGVQVVAVAMVGAKGDVALMALAPDLWDLRRLQTGVQSAGLEVVDSYVSVTEVSEYAAGMPAEMLQARLHPTLPPDGLRAYCFYPMSKRRAADHNWYALPFEERDRLMRQHGAVGREFRGRVLQLVTGSTGLDDFEWGVTLFGAHVDDLKEVVYRMRFDEATTHYGEFGPFYTGVVGTLAEVLEAAVS
jgi:hydrogen peroxide-dependent heme synthase